MSIEPEKLSEFEEKVERAFNYACRCKGKAVISQIPAFMEGFEEILKVELENPKLFLTIESDSGKSQLNTDHIKRLIDKAYSKPKGEKPDKGK